MDKEYIKERLWHYGHFNNPEHPTSVKKSDLPKLTLTSPEVRTALKSWQDMMKEDFDNLSMSIHGRKGVVDGDIGPATNELFNVPRCGEPDYKVEGATNNYRTEEATGRGSWPSGCYKEYPHNHAITVLVDKRGMPAFLNGVFEDIWERVADAYRDIGMVLIRNNSRLTPGTRLTFEPLRGSTIGLAIVPSRPNCGEYIWLKLDPSYRPSDIFNQWCRLTAHELCHNMGLSHTRGGIMNPSIVTGPFTSTAWRGDPSEAALRRFFGGEPVPPREDPDPKPDPDPPKPEPPTDGDAHIQFEGTLTAVVDGKPVGKYQLSPVPKV